MRKTISVDFETPYGKEFSVVELGYWKYARDPRCVPYMISVCDGAEVWAGHPRDFNFESLKGHELLSHNMSFDSEVALGAAERGLWAIEGYDQWHCTANMAAYLWNVRSLADSMKTGFGIVVDKGVRDRAKDKSWDDMVREGWSEDMLKYARADAQHCWMLWNKYGHLWPADERRLSHLTIEQGRYGVQIDVDALEFAQKSMKKVIFNATQNLPWIARGRLPASPIGLAEECRLVGIPTPPVKAYDPEAAQEWEDMYAPLHKFVLALRNLRKAKKTLATLETIALRLRPDNTVAISTKYFGAHTGRWSGDSGWNVQNMNREPFFINNEGSFVFDKDTIKGYVDAYDEQHFEVPGIDVVDMRGLIVARPGKKLIPPDLSQIEPRVLNWLAGDWDFLELIRQGYSPYEAHARAANHVKWTGGDLKKENKKLYQMMKIEVLMYGYQAGYEKAIVFAAQNGIDLTIDDRKVALEEACDGKIYHRWRYEGKWRYSANDLGAPLYNAVGSPDKDEDCIFVLALNRKGEEYLKVLPVYGMQARVAVRNFRESKPKLTDLWQAMDDKLRCSVGGDFVVELPSGRKLTYRNVRESVRTTIDKETGLEVKKKVITAEIGGRRSIFYGGLIVENITQATARDVFAAAWLRIDAAGITTLFSVHDELVCETDLSVEPKYLEEMMSVTPDWLTGCPIGAEAKEMFKYAK